MIYNYISFSVLKTDTDEIANEEQLGLWREKKIRLWEYSYLCKVKYNE